MPLLWFPWAQADTDWESGVAALVPGVPAEFRARRGGEVAHVGVGMRDSLNMTMRRKPACGFGELLLIDLE